MTTYVDFIETCKMSGDGDGSKSFGVVTRLSGKAFIENINKLLNHEVEVLPMKTVNGDWLLVTRSFLDTYTPMIIDDKNVSEEIKNKVK